MPLKVFEWFFKEIFMICSGSQNEEGKRQYVKLIIFIILYFVYLKESILKTDL